MNARIAAGYAVAFFIVGGTAAVLIADAPRALAQARTVPPPPPGVQAPWSASRPPGVSPDHWIPISGAFGIVIVGADPPLPNQPRGTIPRSLEGYFVVRHAGQWWHLRATAAGIVPLALMDEASVREEAPRR